MTNRNAPGIRPRRVRLRPSKLERNLDTWKRSIERTIVTTANLQQRSGVARPAVPIVDWFEVQSEAGAYLECHRRDTTDDYQVAKPYTLQGFTATKILVTGGDTHEITPAYATGDKILAVYVPGGAGVGFATGSDTVPYHFIDLNIDGRQLARVPPATGGT